MPQEAVNAMLARNRTGATPSHDDILAEYARLGLRPITGGDGNDDAAAKAAADAKAAEDKAATDAKAKADADEAAKLGDAGKKALDAEREARSVADKAAKEAQKELTALRKEKADREESARKAAEDKAKADGEWEKLASERETTLSTITAERDALAKTVESYTALITPLVKERHDTLKTADAEVAKGFPADADPLTQLAWLDDPRTKAVLSRQDQRADNLRGVPMTPRPNGNPIGQADEEARRQAALRYRRG